LDVHDQGSSSVLGCFSPNNHIFIREEKILEAYNFSEIIKKSLTRKSCLDGVVKF
jgi:hypothetical protein